MKYTKNKRIQGVFPIHQYRFNTENHPVITSTAKRQGRLVIPLSHNEDKLLEGLANTLQCDKNEAVRIALYEFRQLDGVSDEVMLKASSVTTDPSHTSRKKKLTVKLPGKEDGNALGLSEKEAVRAALIWLRDGIRNDHITRLTNSPIIPIEQVMREWSKNRPEDAEAKYPSKNSSEFRGELRRGKESGRDRGSASARDHRVYLMDNPLDKNLLSQGLISYEVVERKAMMEERQEMMDIFLDTLDPLSETPEDEEELDEDALEEMIAETTRLWKETPKKHIDIQSHPSSAGSERKAGN